MRITVIHKISPGTKLFLAELVDHFLQGVRDMNEQVDLVAAVDRLTTAVNAAVEKLTTPSVDPAAVAAATAAINTLTDSLTAATTPPAPPTP